MHHETRMWRIRVPLWAIYLDNNRSIVSLSIVHRWNNCRWLWCIIIVQYCFSMHVLSLIYIHPWHHICLLRITYPDLSLFYFPVTWLFKWSCGFSGVSSLFALIYILWRLTGTFIAPGIYESMLYRLATDCLSESNDVGVFRGGASVG